MRIADLNWMQVEQIVHHEDRCVLPIGCIEQHAYLSLATDTILAERLSIESAATLGIPVFPVLAYGVTPSLRAYPGTISLRLETYGRLLIDLLDGIANSGFRRIFILNGHGGNIPAMTYAMEWLEAQSGLHLQWHDWWSSPRVWAKVQAIDPDASHASWMENFPWTRLEGVEMPDTKKPMVDWKRIRIEHPRSVRDELGDGSFGGDYAKAGSAMLELWEVALAETRELLENGWVLH